MRRTTILADEGLLIEAKHLAEQQGTTLTALVQDALREYIGRHRPARRRLSIAGIGRSGYSDTSQRVDDILRAETDPIGGWSPRRRSAENSQEPLDASSGQQTA